mmetsp:Transcript_22060/g.38085  ORF Transcript_22060/g.38085 Transcript_22060/m.38085 type:complete len:122 (+) Transcript_22060:124-489(+)
MFSFFSDWWNNNTTEDTMALATTVTQLIESATVVIFSKTSCGYCSRVKALYKDLAVKSIAIYELDRNPQGGEIQKELYRMTGQSTVPSVWIAKKHVGGCDDSVRLNNQGQLVPMLKAAGAM